MSRFFHLSIQNVRFPGGLRLSCSATCSLPLLSALYLSIHLSIYPSSIYPLCSYSYALGFPERAQQLVVPVEENSVVAHRSPPELRPTAVALPSRLMIPSSWFCHPMDLPRVHRSKVLAFFCLIYEQPLVTFKATGRFSMRMPCERNALFLRYRYPVTGKNQWCGQQILIISAKCLR